MLRQCLAAATAVAFALPAAAQDAPAASTAPVPGSQAKEPRDRSLYFSDEQMREIAAAPDPATGKPRAQSKRLIAYSNHSTALIRLNKPDVPHAHGTVSEIFVIREGGGVLETGGTITGITGTDSATHGDIFSDPRPAMPAGQVRRGAPGDLAGTAIDGGARQQMKPGDIVLIPAGVAHHWIAVDGSVVYLDIKFPKAN